MALDHGRAFAAAGSCSAAGRLNTHLNSELLTTPIRLAQASLVLVTCHSDICASNLLVPDWLYDTGELTCE